MHLVNWSSFSPNCWAMFTKCITDETALKALNDRVDKFSQKDQVRATPTFLINGTRLEGYETLPQLDAVIQPMLK